MKMRRKERREKRKGDLKDRKSKRGRVREREKVRQKIGTQRERERKREREREREREGENERSERESERKERERVRERERERENRDSERVRDIIERDRESVCCMQQSQIPREPVFGIASLILHYILWGPKHWAFWHFAVLRCFAASYKTDNLFRGLQKHPFGNNGLGKPIPS